MVEQEQTVSVAHVEEPSRRRFVTTTASVVPVVPSVGLVRGAHVGVRPSQVADLDSLNPVQ
jgi:hypothetical protein